MRPTAVGEGAKPKPPPPALIMKLIARLHPEMRRRNRAAAHAWETKLCRQEVDRWFDSERAQVVETNLAFQGTDLVALDDAALVEQLADLVRHFQTQARLNLETHGGDLIPAGDFLAHCKGWGISISEASALLQGSSPPTVETAQLLAPVAEAVAAAENPPTSVGEVRALSPDADRAVSAWLELHGWRLLGSDDVDKPTLAERPALQLVALLAAGDTGPADEPDASVVRTMVPPDQRELFDELLVEARYGMRQRDDSVGVRWNWSGGLTRRGLLEAGRRLVSRDLLEAPEHAVELSPAEIASLLTDGTGPSRAEIAARATWRDVVEASNPPDFLGEREPPPPVDALPRAMARSTAAMMTALEAEGLASDQQLGPLAGTGVGTSAYRGRARVATSADDALERLEPGDVLVAPFTGPAYNSLLPVLGALVVEAGGPMCHAAIAAREFAIPAVIGAAGATSHIADGAFVEVDPIAATVRVIAT